MLPPTEHEGVIMHVLELYGLNHAVFPAKLVSTQLTQEFSSHDGLPRGNLHRRGAKLPQQGLQGFVPNCLLSVNK